MEPRRTARSRTPTSSCCGDRTPARRTRSSSIMCLRHGATGRSCSWSTRGERRAPNGPTAGCRSRWAPTSRWRTRSPARSSVRGSCTATSSPGRPRVSRSTPRRWRNGRSPAARTSPASQRARSVRWRTRTRLHLTRSSVGRSASRNTTTVSTTCWRSSTWRSCAGTWADTAPASTRCAARTTSREAVTWVPSRTACRAFRTSWMATRARSSTPRGVRLCRRTMANTSRRCSMRWSNASCARCTSWGRTRPRARPIPAARSGCSNHSIISSCKTSS